MKTYSIKAADIKREWHIVDASDKVLGRLATQIAGLLMGKHKPMFSRNMDVGDFVIIVNGCIGNSSMCEQRRNQLRRPSRINVEHPGGVYNEQSGARN